MFEVVMKLLNRNQKTSKEIAKDRLKVVLIHDRANISPEVMQALKNDIIEVISHYMDIIKMKWKFLWKMMIILLHY